MIVIVPIQGKATAYGVGTESDPLRWSFICDRIAAIGRDMGIPSDFESKLIAWDMDEGNAIVQIDGVDPAVEARLRSDFEGQTMEAIRAALGVGEYEKLW